MATSDQQQVPVQGATAEQQTEGPALFATCRDALDFEDFEGSEVLAWFGPDEADQAFVSWKRASGALPTQVAIELAGTPAKLVVWMVPFDEDEEQELDAETEAGIAALRAELAEEKAAYHPALLFLKALGKNPADTWFRTLKPQPGKGKTLSNVNRKGADLHGFDTAALLSDNIAGSAIYFITGDADQATGKDKYGKPTGCVCDGDVKVCCAVFVEWDDRPIDWQLNAWRELGLPEPSLIVLSGGKSAHCYWLLTEPMAPERWRVLQGRLIAFVKGDTQCKNPSRLMRLPGFRYVDKNTGAVTDHIAEVVHQADVAYSAAEIELCLGEQPPAKGAAFAGSGIEQALESAMELPPRSKAQLLEALKVVPEFHHNEGRRAELLGLAQRLWVEWGPEEAQEWLKQHSPTVTDMASYFSGRKPVLIKDGGIWPFLRDHYGVDLTRHDLRRSMPGSTQVDVPVRDALDAQDRAERQLRFSELRASMEVSLDLRDVLPLRLANVLIEAAEAMPVDPVALLAPLLCAVAATAGTRVEVFVKPGWQEPLVLWMANVMRPGAMKSPIASIVSHPMHRMEAEWREDWEHLVREGGEFVAADQNDPGQPPAVEPVRRIVVGDCTYEKAVELMGQKNIPGLLSLQDELGGFFAQFQRNPVARSGWLTLWSGGPAALDRKTVKSSYAPKTATSLFGNMQPDKLTSLLAEEKGQQSEGGDGLWSRFLWCRPKETVFRWNRDGVDVTHCLQELLESVDQQLQGFRLRLRVDQEVMDEFVGPLFEQWAWDGIQTNSARAAFLSKLRGYTIRFMGVLFLLEMAEQNATGWRNWLNTPPEVEEFQLEDEILSETMYRAVSLAYFYLAQWDALQPEVAPSENDGTPQWVAKFLRKVKDGDREKVTPRDLVSWRLDGRISTSSTALAALKELEEKWGHGVVKQGQRKDQFWWEPGPMARL